MSNVFYTIQIRNGIQRENVFEHFFKKVFHSCNFIQIWDNWEMPFGKQLLGKRSIGKTFICENAFWPGISPWEHSFGNIQTNTKQIQEHCAVTKEQTLISYTRIFSKIYAILLYEHIRI